jgi:phage baseplate assembly protein W
MQIGFPYAVTGAGRTARDDQEQHVRHLIEQVLFTSPGERVNRPDLGTGLQRFVFAGQSDETMAATQFLVQGALQEWLGDIIEVEEVDVTSEEASLVVYVRYRLLSNQQSQAAEFRS